LAFNRAGNLAAVSQRSRTGNLYMGRATVGRRTSSMPNEHLSTSWVLGYERRSVRLFARNARVISRTDNKQQTALICLCHLGV